MIYCLPTMKGRRMHIRRIVDLSTAHITQQDSELLTKLSVDSAAIHDTGYGFIVWVPSHSDHLEDRVKTSVEIEGLSESYCEALRLAFRNDCQFVCFDCDADTVEELEIHDW
jgi:hypothetical protein